MCAASESAAASLDVMIVLCFWRLRSVFVFLGGTDRGAASAARVSPRSEGREPRRRKGHRSRPKKNTARVGQRTSGGRKVEGGRQREEGAKECSRVTAICLRGRQAAGVCLEQNWFVRVWGVRFRVRACLRACICFGLVRPRSLLKRAERAPPPQGATRRCRRHRPSSPPPVPAPAVRARSAATAAAAGRCGGVGGDPAPDQTVARRQPMRARRTSRTTTPRRRCSAAAARQTLRRYCCRQPRRRRRAAAAGRGQSRRQTTPTSRPTTTTAGALKRCRAGAIGTRKRRRRLRLSRARAPLRPPAAPKASWLPASTPRSIAQSPARSRSFLVRRNRRPDRPRRAGGRSSRGAPRQRRGGRRRRLGEPRRPEPRRLLLATRLGCGACRSRSTFLFSGFIYVFVRL